MKFVFAILIALNLQHLTAQDRPVRDQSIPRVITVSAVSNDASGLKLAFTNRDLEAIQVQKMGTRAVSKTVMESRQQSYTNEDGTTSTRTVQVPRQVQEQVAYTYTATEYVHVEKTGIADISTAFLLTDSRSRIPADQSSLRSESTVFVVNTEREAAGLIRKLDAHLTPLHDELGGIKVMELIERPILVLTPEEPMTAETQKIPFDQNRYTWPLPEASEAWVNTNPLKSEDLKGKAAVLWFYEETCPVCRTKWHQVNTMARVFRQKGISFVAVSSGVSNESVATYAKSVGTNLPLICDPERTLETAAGVEFIDGSHVSELVILTPDGNFHATETLSLRQAGEQAVKLAQQIPHSES